MVTQTLISTALPNGQSPDGKFLKVTVFVSPRLKTGGPASLPLADFPAFANWPATLTQVRFFINFDGLGDMPAEPDPQSDLADSALWQLLCGKCSVIDHEFQDYSKRTVRSIPVKAVSDQVLGLYTQIAETAPTSFPPIQTEPLSGFSSELGQLGEKGEFYPQLDNLIKRESGPDKKRGRYLNRALIPPNERTRMAFAEAYRFYDRPGSRDPAGPKKAPERPKPPDIDFHKFCSICGDYPTLLRRLGLAIDLLVPRTATTKAQGRIRVTVKAPHSFETWMNTEAARPWTNYRINGRRFIANSRDKAGDFVDGMLRLENESFIVNEVDVDGSTMKTVDFMANVRRIGIQLSRQQRTMKDESMSLPALRTGGFTVARDNRAAGLVQHLDSAASHEDDHKNGVAIDLFAEDVTRGYRIDVENDKHPNHWLSLCARVGTYLVLKDDGTSSPIDIPPDEGFLKGTSSTSVPGDDDLYLHEAVFGWDGWSLVAKRPGQTIIGNNVGTPDVENPTDIPLITQFTPAPGTLPRLRFGRTYRFRARAVDLAGNSISREDVVPEHVTRPQPFRRFDPVPSPAVIPRRPFTEGESLMRMVIRSTLNVSPTTYVALTRIKKLQGHKNKLLAYIDVNERHLAPPHAAQQLAEWHGEFEKAIGKSASQPALDHAYNIATRDAGSYLDPAPGAFVFNPDPKATPTDLGTHQKGDPLKQGEYVCHDTKQLKLPYLPDPISRGASFTVLPGDLETRLQVWEGTSWPDARPMRVRIKDGTGTPKYTKGLLTVYLPQAEMVTLRLSSYMDKKDLDLMAIWMRQDSASRTAQKNDAEYGRHWMLTPWAPLTLVHAVEKPLQAPVVDVPNDGLKRYAGETFAAISGQIVNHAKSTGRLDIDATWEEPIDDIMTEGPSALSGHNHVSDFLLEANENNCQIGRDDFAPTSAQAAVHRVRHEFGDTKHRWVNYHATATTRFREYFPPEITNDPALITHAGADALRSVPSSRRPDPPDVLYVVPTWTWGGHTITRKNFKKGAVTRFPSTRFHIRSGGGLRVYLNRPWYSSGADELLGVVVKDQPWLTFPIDVVSGMKVSAVDRALADELAEKVFEVGLLKPAGRSSASPSERLMTALGKLSEKTPTPSRVPKGTDAGAVAKLNLDTAFAALHAEIHSQRAKTLLSLIEEGAPISKAKARAAESNLVWSFSLLQQDVLSKIGAMSFLPSGDPDQFVTHWGADPIWGSDRPDTGPYIHQFPLRTAVGTGLSLLEAPNNKVTAVGHQPQFDPVRKLWYCDLQLDAGTSYFPFVRLALARYQPYSIDGHHLSRIVFPDFVQLVTERTAGFTKIGTSAVSVTLRGPGGFTQAAALVTLFTSSDPASVLKLSRFAIAQFERLPSRASTDMAWVPVGDEVRLELSVANGVGDIRYSGTVPRPVVKDGDKLRVALREYEIFETDESEAEDHYVVPPLWFNTSSTKPIRYRLVYADQFDI
jgi:hypothetical protein